MKYLVCCVTLSLLFFANSVSSSVTILAKYDDRATNTKKYEIRQALQLQCNVSTTEPLDANDKLEVLWEKNGVAVSKVKGLSHRYSVSHNTNVYKFQVNNGNETDSGNYSCIAYVNGIEKTRTFITVESTIYVKIPRDLTVIEGETIRVTCKVYGNPTPNLHWTYNNKTFEELEGRMRLENDTENDIANAVFVLEDARLEDQNRISCKGVSKNSNEHSLPSAGTIRVKDKYAALWPFIGICAEVAVLCAIIFVYEKKRNKTELEESDTDQSPEQKNFQDQGGKESNLRHRQ